MDLIVETLKHVFSAQGVKVNGRIQCLFKEGVSMWAELENKWVLNIYHRLGGLNNRNLFSHSSGG